MFVNLRVIDDFYPRSPCGERQLAARDSSIMFVFLSTLSLRRATRLQPWGPGLSGISIHALLAESDGGFGAGSWRLAIFLSTLSLRRATLSMCSWLCGLLFLSTLSLRRATTVKFKLDFVNQISIHALLAESDRFTPHFRADGIHFYPRSPCGERLWYHSLFAMQILISIHALLAESDTVTARIIDPTYDFYPRSPCGERLGSVAVVSRTWNFYPRSPCGERHQSRDVSHQTVHFYPRSPCGERPGRIWSTAFAA